TLAIAPAPEDQVFGNEALTQAESVMQFAVIDTGVGIPDDKLLAIFEAFQQADGTTSRKYGGTGLGLSISREIARLLGGEIRVSSAPGEGSVFTLYLPRTYVPSRSVVAQPSQKSPKLLKEIEAAWTPAETFDDHALALLSSESAAIIDDRNEIQDGDRAVLIVEDDVNFAKILLELAREKGFKGLVATSANVALALAYKYAPVAITLDIRLPDRDGWTLLDRLKHDPKT